MRYYGNYVEKISKNKLYKNGYNFFVSYWTDKVSQQNMLTNLLKGHFYEDYVYTQKRDETGLFHVVVYIKKLERTNGDRNGDDSSGTTGMGNE